MSTPKIELLCKKCSSSFLILQKEYNRQIKKGREANHFFCSLKCASSYNIQQFSPMNDEQNRRKLSCSMMNNTNRKKGNFTYYLNKAKHRYKNRKFEFDLSEQYLEQIWLMQKGECVYTKIKLHLKHGKSKLDTASLDRIDSSKGYVIGNVQFVSYGINLAKGAFTEQEFSEFLNKIKTGLKDNRPVF